MSSPPPLLWGDTQNVNRPNNYMWSDLRSLSTALPVSHVTIQGSPVADCLIDGYWQTVIKRQTCHSNEHGMLCSPKHKFQPTPQEKQKINHLESAVDRNEERVASGCGKNGQLLVRRDLLDKIAALNRKEFKLYCSNVVAFTCIHLYLIWYGPKLKLPALSRRRAASGLESCGSRAEVMIGSRTLSMTCSTYSKSHIHIDCYSDVFTKQGDDDSLPCRVLDDKSNFRGRKCNRQKEFHVGMASNGFDGKGNGHFGDGVLPLGSLHKRNQEDKMCSYSLLILKRFWKLLNVLVRPVWLTWLWYRHGWHGHRWCRDRTGRNWHHDGRSIAADCQAVRWKPIGPICPSSGPR